MSTTRVSGRYTLDRRIGHGGSGAVWLGRDEVLGRAVALKRVGMPPGSVDADVLRAEREARLAARVNHPHVVAVFDFVETPDGHWLVMEYVEGSTLAQMITERGALEPEQVAPLLVQVADALAAAHAATVVHRDVKPSNILVRPDGEAKLSDFGIARGVADSTLTRTGLVTGSPAYLSPEVASGASATPASDVWSFGATLFHALAGKPPYEVGDNLMGAMYRIVHEEPPRLSSAGWLASLLEMTMTRDAAARPTMAEVRDYLRAPAAEGSARRVVPPPVAPVAPVAPPRAAAVPAEDAEIRTVAMPVPPPPAPPRSRQARPTEAARPTGSRQARPTAGPTGSRQARPTEAARPRALVPWLIGAAVVLVVLAGAVLMGGDEEPAASGGSEPGTSQSPGTSSASPSDGATEGGTDSTVTAEELENFAASYVQTASEDPAAGFGHLTPAYQARSTEYEQFWGAVRSPRILEISADPAALTVTYTYRYALRGDGNRTETVTLHLVREGDRLLIDGAS